MAHIGRPELNDLGSHLLDLVPWLAGDGIELLLAETANFKFRREVEDSGVLVLRLPTEWLGTIEVSSALPTAPSTVDLYGTGGRVRCRGTFEDGVLIADTDETWDSRPETPAEAYRRQLEDFLYALRGDGGVGTDHRSASVNVGIIEQAVRGTASVAAGS